MAENNYVLLNHFVKEEWINDKPSKPQMGFSDYRQTWLRRLSRETKTQYVSDVQRYFRNFEDGVDDRIFHPKWAKRYVKNHDGSLSARRTRLHNPNGYYKLTVLSLNELKTLECEKSYDELFKTDVRIIQAETSSPRNNWEKNPKWLQRSKDPEKYDFDFTLHRCCILEQSQGHWNEPLIKWLETTFQKPIYYCYEYINEHWEQGILSRNAIYMHINHFGDDKKIISFQENYHNRTIAFWLFKDRLVFAYEDGKDTH